MLFSDEPRFSKQLISHPTHEGVSGVSKSSTEAHVGPGSYLATQFEERRCGWSKPGFSKRQPMEEPKTHIARSEHYISGVLSPNGTMSTPISPSRSKSPGPGYYEGPVSVFSFPSDPKRKQDLNLSTMSGANATAFSTRHTNMMSSPRFSFSNSTCLNKGIIFQSASNDHSTVGPGYYSVPRNDFLKKSHNVRVRGPENRVRSAANTPVTTPVNSPFKKQPSTEVRQVTTPRSTYRPTSAGASRVGSGGGSASGNTSPNVMHSPVRRMSNSGGSVNGGSVNGGGSVYGGSVNGGSVSGNSVNNRYYSSTGSVSGNSATANTHAAPRSPVPATTTATVGATATASASARSRSSTPSSVRPRSASTPRSGVTTPSSNSIASSHRGAAAPRTPTNGSGGAGLFSEHGNVGKPQAQRR